MKIIGKEIFEHKLILKSGRIDYDDKNFKLYYSLSGIEFNASGKLKMSFETEEKVKAPFISIVINHEVFEYKINDKMEVDFNLEMASNVKVLKRTGINDSIYINLINLEIESLLKIKEKDYLEIIGDSLTCGYGNMGNRNAPYVTETENGLLGYGYLVCQHLNMLPNFLCKSGYPMYKSPYSSSSIVDYYDVICENNPKEYQKAFMKSKMIMINLGTNDNAYLRNLENTEEHENFYAKYFAFLNKIRKNNPKIPILMITTDKQLISIKYIEKVFQDFDDENKYYLSLEFDYNKELGCGGHPSTEQHKIWSKVIIKYIEENIYT